jgi:hypothetical protein
MGLRLSRLRGLVVHLLPHAHGPRASLAILVPRTGSRACLTLTRVRLKNRVALRLPTRPSTCSTTCSICKTCRTCSILCHTCSSSPCHRVATILSLSSTHPLNTTTTHRDRLCLPAARQAKARAASLRLSSRKPSTSQHPNTLRPDSLRLPPPWNHIISSRTR